MGKNIEPLKVFPSRPCDWLLLVLAMRAQGAPLTKTDGKKESSKAFGDGTKTIQRVIAR